MQIKPPYVIRSTDRYGMGYFKAPRQGGRLHKGIDPCCKVGDEILSVSCGVVTKIGFPYSQAVADASWSQEQRSKHEAKKARRYVEVTDLRGLRVRYFYVNPKVAVGDTVHKDTLLGIAQGVGEALPGIIEHFHFEVLPKGNGQQPLDPNEYLYRLTCREH